MGEERLQALRVLRQNVAALGFGERSRIIAGDAFAYLASGSGPFEVVYLAPPQYQGLWLKALRQVDQRPDLLSERGQAIVQIFPKEWSEPGLANLHQLDRRQYGSTALYFFGRARQETPEEPPREVPAG